MNVKNFAKNTLYIILALLAAILFTGYLYASGNYPQGSDVYGHIWKADVLRQAILDGEYFPIYTPYWYNAVELCRYWPPLSHYILAISALVMESTTLHAFPVYIGICFFVSMCGWLLFAQKENRRFVCFIFGVLCFSLPDSFHLIFSEGNVPRVLVSALLPSFFFCMWNFVHYRKKASAIPFVLLLAMITYTHIMTSAMVGVTLFLYLLFYGIAHKEWRYELTLLITAVLTYPLCGIFLVSGLTGGIMSMSDATANVIQYWTQTAADSLNPFLRYVTLDYFYFGLAAFFIILLGILASGRDTVPGFFTSLCIFIGTISALTPVLMLIPLSQVLWMQRFVPMALCLFIMSVILWKKLKKSALLLFALLLILDSIPSMGFLEWNEQTAASTADMRVQDNAEEHLFNAAADMTENRTAVMDTTLWGSFSSYYFARDLKNKPVSNTFGWFYQAAVTVDEITNVNESLEYGYYMYMFDRLLEYGNDTILVKKNMVPPDKLLLLDDAAEKRGYQKKQENETAILYKLDLNGALPGGKGRFGTVNRYDSLAVGDYALQMCYIYPRFQLGDSINLTDYTLEELISYKKIYLSGFTYDDKAQAEKLLRQAADSGVEIYIDMTHIPEDRLTGKNEFLGVYSQFVQFTEHFPVLTSDNGDQFRLDFESTGYFPWNTAYLSGLDHVIKSTFYDDKSDLAYFGTNDSPNIYFMGLNLVYYYFTTNDEQLLYFLNDLFDVSPDDLPDREIVPVNITFDYDKVSVHTDYDHTNINIAALDCFQPNRPVDTAASLLIVDQGDTVFTVHYPYFKEGCVVSLLGILLIAAFWIFANFVLLTKSSHRED